MASRSSPASPVSTSALNSRSVRRTGRSATSRSSRSARTCSWLGWRMDSLTALPSSAISDPLTHEDFVARWISCTRGSPASPTASPASAGATTILGAGTSSSTPSESSASADPPWSSSRTSQPGLPGDGFDDAARRYRDWVTASKARSFAVRRMSGRRIGESGSSSWPTASARDGDPRRGPTAPTSKAWLRKVARGAVNAAGLLSDDLSSSAAQWATPRAEERGQYNSRDNYEALSRQAAFWMTPSARDWKDGANPSEKAPTRGLLGRQAPRSGIGGPTSSPDGPNSPPLWPTPGEGDYKGPNPSLEKSKQRQAALGVNKQTMLRDLAPRWQTPRTGAHGTPGEGKGHGGQPKGMRLNPRFVEWLQGLPLGWTDSAPSATPVSQPKLPTPS